MTRPHPLLNNELSWHDRKRWDEALSYLTQLLKRRRGGFAGVEMIAHQLKRKIDDVDSYIQLNTSQVCPECQKACCINKHGYYDYQDIIYITALGIATPNYREGIEDTAPCQFLSVFGCRIERSLRPFRCNWHFCNELIAFMNLGPAKSLRKFNNKFQELQALRQETIDQFFMILLKKS